MADDDLRWTSGSVSVPLLRAAASDQHLDLHLAAIEYALATPITIRDRDDIKSQKHWSEHFEPFEHQVRNLITFCRRAPVALIADDVGLGKTISAGLVLSELMTRKKVKRALILAPKLLLPQWCDELSGKFKIEAREASGSQLDYLVRSTVPVVVTTYETARSKFGTLSKSFFDMIILDEAHKLRNLHGGNRAPIVAEAVLESFRRTDFKFVLMLTATPIQNRLWDIYSLVDLLATARGHRNPLGSPAEFSSYFLQDSATTARELHPGRREEFRRKLSEYMVRTSRRDSRLIFPERTVKTLPCPPGTAENRLTNLISTALPKMNALARSSIAQALMSSPAALLSQLRNMAANGTVPANLPQQAEALVSQVGPGCKMARLVEFLQELAKEKGPDWRAVVFTRRKETQDLIGRTLAETGVRVGYIRGGQPSENQRSIKGLWADPPEVNLLVSTDAGAEGVNLQTANIVINYDLPWNPMVVEQRIGRVQRLMTRHKNIVVVNLVVKDSVEQRVVARLIAKLQAIAQTIGDIEGILESTSSGEDGMEETIQDLVLKALMGQDVAEATERIRQSIENAKTVYEQERGEVERNLGGLDAMHSAGPKMPALEEVKPRLPVDDFVRKAMAAGGATVSALPGGQWLVRVAGRPPVVVTFNENDPDLVSDGLEGFHGRRVEYFAEGRPPFERLVGEWSKRDGARLRDWTDEDGSKISLLLRTWLSDLGEDVTLENWRPLVRRPQFVGNLIVKASASVAIDRYEKLAEVKVGSQEIGDVLSAAKDDGGWVAGEVALKDSIRDVEAAVRACVAEDKDVGAFCRFYEQRRDEEAVKSGDRRSVESAAKRFQPYLAAEVVAASGHLYEEVDLELQTKVAGGGPYKLVFSVRTGTQEILRHPELASCGLSDRLLPQPCLAKSALSDRFGLQHLMATSDRSGRLGMPDEIVVCAVSGRRLLSDEVAFSDVSARIVDTDLLVKSPVSGRAGLADETVVCEFSKAKVLSSEGLKSQVSGRTYRVDQEATSAVSGVRGHRSEFLRCEASGTWMLPAESAESSASGKRVRSDLLVRSDVSGRTALESETVVCEFTGVRALRAEARQSMVSGRWYRTDEEAVSAVSAVRGHRTEFVTCEESGSLVLASEVGRSVVSGRLVRKDLLAKSSVSGSLALDTELLRCEFTRVPILPSEGRKSEVSGRLYRCDQEARSSVSQLAGHQSEFRRCDETGRTILPVEGMESSVSGKFVRRDLLVPSDRDPSRVGLRSETAICSVTGKRLLTDEVGKSVVSGRVVDRTQLSRSDRSGSPALPAELVTCEISGRMLLPDETGVCEVSGLRVDADLLRRSDFSNRLVQKTMLHRCVETGKWGMEAEMGRCSVTGSLVDPGTLVVCSITEKPVLSRLAVKCEVSGRTLLRVHAIVASSGRVGHPEVASTCVWTGWVRLADECGRCRLTGVVLSSAELDDSGISRAHVDLIRDHASAFPAEGQLIDEIRGLLETAGHKASRIWARKSPHVGTAAVFAECKSLFGLRRRYAVCFFNIAPPALDGKVAIVGVREGVIVSEIS